MKMKKVLTLLLAGALTFSMGTSSVFASTEDEIAAARHRNRKHRQVLQRLRPISVVWKAKSRNWNPTWQNWILNIMNLQTVFPNSAYRQQRKKNS